MFHSDFNLPSYVKDGKRPLVLHDDPVECAGEGVVVSGWVKLRGSIKNCNLRLLGIADPLLSPGIIRGL